MQSNNINVMVPSTLTYPCLLENSYVTATTAAAAKLEGKMSLINKLMIQVY